MTRLERLSAILILLQGKRVLAGAEIARRFGVSLRTVYRDIRSLEEAGVPVGAEAGRGYFLADGYRLPPVSFTVGEASALVAARKLTGPLLDEPVRRQLDSAADKALAVLSPALRDAAEALDLRIVALARPAVPQHLDGILSAIRANRVLSVRYAAAGGEPTARDVEPLILCFYGTRWILFAYCRLRRAYRSFRIDRFTELALREETFDPAAHAAGMKKAKNALAARRPAV